MLRQANRSILRRAKLPQQFAVASRAYSSALQWRAAARSQRALAAPASANLVNNLSAQRWFSSYPEHMPMDMPALSPTMEFGTIAEWCKYPGDPVAPGDILAQIETDKATVAFESVEEGFMAKIIMPEGSADVPVGTPICIMVEEEADVAAFANYSADAAPAEAAPAAAAPAAPAPSPAAPTPVAPTPAAPAAVASGERVFASPAAKRVGRERGIDVTAVTGTGGAVGRVTSADVLAFTPAAAVASPVAAAVAPAPAAAVAAAPAAPAAPALASADYSDITNSNIKKVTAARLTQSKQTTPHYYLSMECRVDKVLAMRAQFNDGREKQAKLSVNDFIIKASALALMDVPEVNSTWMDSFVRQYNYVDISVAVATPTGLMTPIVMDAHTKGLNGISSTVKELAGRAQTGQLQPNEFMGGTFTISNLGMFGIDSFSAIINPPQAAILAVGTTTERLVSAPKGSEQPYDSASFMTVSLSCDHRVIDGAVAARWLQAFKGYLEDPLKMLL